VVLWEGRGGLRCGTFLVALSFFYTLSCLDTRQAEGLTDAFAFSHPIYLLQTA